jgi:uncharacterized protein YbjQ (UPF0145 family)
MTKYNIFVSTTANIEGYDIVDYYGLVTGEAILGSNILRDFVANLTDMVGGRSKTYETALTNARNAAIEAMLEKAAEFDAHAVIGVDIDYETIGNQAMMMVCVSGTAVKIAKK